MTSLFFEKWEATGNDFVVVDLDHCPLQADDFTTQLAVSVCDREHGIGADGVVLLRRGQSSNDPAEVIILNADGSRPEMCGNALRCVAMILAREAGPQQRSVRIGQRLVDTWIEGSSRAAVMMGPAVPVDGHPIFAKLPELDGLLSGDGHLVSFGNPHYVLPCPRIPESWETLGAASQGIADRLLGTNGINSGFLEATAEPEGAFRLRVFERGVGVTASCGSGACAASAVLEKILGVAPPHRLSLPGGTLEVQRQHDQFVLIGPAAQEFDGHWEIA